LSLLMLAESLPYAPVVLTIYLRSKWNALLPRVLLRIRGFGIMLEPRWIVGTGLLDQ
jgi:hypothetical protein